jgi:hypothetical protein
MATFRLRRFSHPDALKAISPERLVSFLRPYETYFAGRGLAISLAIDYDDLVRILINPDEDVPPAMVEALYYVHEMADPSVMEELLSVAAQRGIDLQAGDEPTAADVAMGLWLQAPELLQEKHRESFVARPRSFEYYSGATGRRRPFPAHDAELLARMGSHLDNWFVEKKRGDGTTVFVYPQGGKVQVLIRHGATMWREGMIKKGKRGTVYYRPEVHDVLVYDTAMDSLGLKAGTKGERELYRHAIGQMLFGSESYFARRMEFSLEPLREFGPEAMTSADVPGLNGATLIEVRRFIGGETKERQIHQATDLFRAFGEHWKRRLGFGKLVGATFEVKLGPRSAERVRKVTISPPNFAKYDRDDDDADVIERWLRRRGFMPKSDEVEDAAAATDQVLASSRTSPGPGYRATGVATAAE